MESLEQALDRFRIALKSDGYQMSIGELANLYEDGELSMNPEFQRNIRWNHSDKTAFVESVLMQFPLPSIFVAATAEGKWDLLDGLQRVTTLFEFMGILKDSNGNLVPPLVLGRTEKLPQLEGCTFGFADGQANRLSTDLQRDFKRSRMDVKIVLRESSSEMKFDLFLRLSTGGTPLSAQDARNAVMANVEANFRNWVERLSVNKIFLDSLSLSERDLAERYHEELVLVFLVLASDTELELEEAGEIEGGLDQLLSRLVRSPESRLYNYDREALEKTFDDTFNVLYSKFEGRPFEISEDQQGSVTGLQRKAFIAICAATAAAFANGRVPQVLGRLAEYWQQRPLFATFKDAVMWGRRLASY